MTYGTIVVCGGGCYGGYYVRQLARARATGAMVVDRIVVVDRDPDCAVARLATAIRSDDLPGIAANGWRLRTSGVDAAPPHLDSAYRGLPIEVITSEWGVFFDRWLDAAIGEPEGSERDAVVPSPLMPHLLADWVAARLRLHRPLQPVARIPLAVTPDTPWQRTAPDLAHYASFATWMCPINCIEPPRCPETRGPRNWTMPAIVTTAAAAAAEQGSPYDAVALFHTTHRHYGVGMFDARDAVSIDAAIRRAAHRPRFRVLVASVSHCHGALAALESSTPG